MCYKTKKGYAIISLRSDHEGESGNNDFAKYYEKNGINHNFSTLKSPQQNGVAKRKNECLKEMALNESSFPKTF